MNSAGRTPPSVSVVGTEEIGALDATAQATLVRNGTVSALELVGAAIKRIEMRNPHIGAIVDGVVSFLRTQIEGRRHRPGSWCP